MEEPWAQKCLREILNGLKKHLMKFWRHPMTTSKAILSWLICSTLRTYRTLTMISHWLPKKWLLTANSCQLINRKLIQNQKSQKNWWRLFLTKKTTYIIIQCSSSWFNKDWKSRKLNVYFSFINQILWLLSLC